MKGKQFLSDLKFYSDYAKWNETRYETWEESCDDVFNTFRDRYGDKINHLLDECLPLYKNKQILVSQRCLQYRSKQLQAHNVRLYNCATTYAYSPDLFDKYFYVLLCGAGVGVSLKQKFVKQLPVLHKRNCQTITYVVPDTIEGWATALKVLISSYCNHISLFPEYFGANIRFDYSLIREKGAFLSGGFKAPGYEGLKKSLEKIENLINTSIGENNTIIFSSILVYDVLMHISDAVLSGGVRRSSSIIIFDYEDKEMLGAKTGDWFSKNPQRARSNNSVGILRKNITKEIMNNLLRLNNEDNDVGIILQNVDNEVFNPCGEIGFCLYDQIKNHNETVFDFCNLNEINGGSSKKSNGSVNEELFFQQCRIAAILGTLQAGFTNFPYLGKQTENIVRGESLLGVSITGWMENPALFNPILLTKGAEIVKITNKEVSELIGINQSARTTTVKPSGNASVLLKTTSGVHPEHSKRYFRVMQLNKESEVSKYLLENNKEMLEESLWSSINSDYVVFVPCETTKGTLYKSDIKGVEHLELVKMVQQYWVGTGKNESLCYNPSTSHNVSNTIVIDDYDTILNYVYDNKEFFTGLSFISETGDKDYTQAPFTSVLDSQELLDKYGDGVIFVSGLVVDGLHYFDTNLWKACEYVLNGTEIGATTRDKELLQKDWIRRVKNFAKKYLKNDLKQTIYCLKDIHLWHKWNKITQNMKDVNIGTLLSKPTYKNIDEMGAIACNSSGVCEITF